MTIKPTETTSITERVWGEIGKRLDNCFASNPNRIFFSGTSKEFAIWRMVKIPITKTELWIMRRTHD